MAGIQQIIKTSELSTSTWKEVMESEKPETFISYDEIEDALTLLIAPPNISKIVHYLNEHVALLFDLETKQVIGLRIESFKRAFLPKYANLNEYWKLRGGDLQLHDFGDLAIAANIFELEKPLIAYEISKIAHHIAEEQGLYLYIPT